MAMEVMTCPYCHSRVRLTAVEADEGTCPECGTPLMGSSIFAPDLDADDIYDLEGGSNSDDYGDGY